MHVKKRHGCGLSLFDTHTHHRNSWLVLLRASKTNSEGRETLSAQQYLQA